MKKVTFLLTFIIIIFLNKNTSSQTINFNSNGWGFGQPLGPSVTDNGFSFSYESPLGVPANIDATMSTSTGVGIYCNSATNDVLTIASTDGSEFDFTSFYCYNNQAATIRIRGYKDGGLVATQTGFAVTNNATNSVSSINSDFQNVDTIIFDSASGPLGLSSGYDDFTFEPPTTPDTTAPAFENSTPSATSIAGTSFTLNADIDEEADIYYVVLPDGVTAPTSSEVKAGSGPGGAPVSASGNSSVSTSPYSTTYNITGLTSEDSYDVYVVAEDDDGNLNNTPSKIDVTTADVNNPAFVTENSTPNDNATNVSISDNIIIDFNENIELETGLGAGSITIRDVTGNTDFEAFDVNIVSEGATTTPSSGFIGIVNDKIYINPSNNLTGDNNYSIRIDATAVDDLNGNSFAGITNDTTYNFKTIDNVSPTLSSSTPADDATNIATNSDIVLTFDENIAFGTGNIQLKKNSDDSVVFSIDAADPTATSNVASISNAVLTINPSASALDDQTDYYLIIPATAIDDTKSNSYAGISVKTTLNFVTTDETAPTFDSTPSSSNITSTGFTLSVDLNEAGHIYYVVLTDGATTPTATEVKAGTGSGGSAVVTSSNNDVDSGNFTLDFNVINLTATTAYDIYVVAEDDETSPNLQVSPTKIDVTTANPTNTFNTTSGNWSEDGNWSLGRVPLITDNVVVPSSANRLTVDISNAVANNVSVENTAKLDIEEGKSLTINGNLTNNGKVNLISESSSNASLIVNGTADNGDITYDRHLTTDGSNASRGWHLISSPLSGISISNHYDDFVQNGTKRAIAPYVNTNPNNSKWSFYTTADTGINFVNGKGYSIKVPGSSQNTILFEGTIITDDVSIQVDATGDQFNALGNPFTAFINSGTFLDNVTAGRLTEKTIWLWDEGGNSGAGEYITKNIANEYKIAPGQGFFVQALATGNVTLTESIQTHSGGNTFLKQASRPEIKLSISDKTNVKSTEIFYIINKTTGFDDGYDSSMFNNGSSNSFAVYTQLVTDNEGKNLAVQTLPNSNYENMVIPIGLNADANKEITFSLNANNFPVGIKIYLEDKENNTFTRLDEINNSYKITLNSSQNGIGRFYLHTKNNVLNIDENLSQENISIYKLNNSTLRITGLFHQKSEVSIFNILGKKVLNTTFIANEKKDIALPNLSKGIYLVQLKTENSKLNKKIILE